MEVLRRSGPVRIRAQGTSMLPTLWPGDLLSVETVVFDDVVTHDIVLILRGGRPVVHRVVGKSENGSRVVTRGDAMPGRDLSDGSEELLGRVVEIRRFGRSLQSPRQHGVPRRAVGLVLCHCDSLRGLLLRVHSWRSKRFSQAESGCLLENAGLNRTA